VSSLTKNPLELSVVLPVYNEEDNLKILHKSITDSLAVWGRNYEILYVDDGSVDKSLEVLQSLEAADAHVRVFTFRRNFGQTAAMAAGIEAANGKMIAFLDSDGQNDPSDIPKLVAKLEEGYDLVSGYRERRQDPFLTRILPSKIANFIIRKATGVHLQDYGCSLKVYRAELLKSFHLYGEMHRFIPAHCAWIGARMTELPVKHHPRIAGVSKYGLMRTLKVVLDLGTVKFLGSYATKPIYVFGSVSLVCGFVAFALAAFVIVRKIMDSEADWMSPMILGSLFMASSAVQIFLMGLLAEIMIRIYHESQKLPIYHLRTPEESTEATVEKADPKDNAGS
jgi:glycosyltransferase involved in cell wall biosynthesis